MVATGARSLPRPLRVFSHNVLVFLVTVIFYFISQSNIFGLYNFLSEGLIHHSPPTPPHPSEQSATAASNEKQILIFSGITGS